MSSASRRRTRAAARQERKHRRSVGGESRQVRRAPDRPVIPQTAVAPLILELTEEEMVGTIVPTTAGPKDAAPWEMWRYATDHRAPSRDIYAVEQLAFGIEWCPSLPDDQAEPPDDVTLTDLLERAERYPAAGIATMAELIDDMRDRARMGLISWDSHNFEIVWRADSNIPRPAWRR
jgi:hypothetical protein